MKGNEKQFELSGFESLLIFQRFGMQWSANKTYIIRNCKIKIILGNNCQIRDLFVAFKLIKNKML